MNKFKNIVKNLHRIIIKNKLLSILCVFILLLEIIAVPKIFAQPQAIKSVEIFSEKLDYGKKEPGSDMNPVSWTKRNEVFIWGN